jgi:hypothetical protein
MCAVASNFPPIIVDYLRATGVLRLAGSARLAAANDVSRLRSAKRLSAFSAQRAKGAPPLLWSQWDKWKINSSTSGLATGMDTVPPALPRVRRRVR